MNILLYKDNTLPIDMELFCSILNKLCQTVVFETGNAKFHIDTTQVNSPNTYNQLSSEIEEESKDFDTTILVTNVQYDNNYFFEGYGNKTIISFFGWHRLTDLPIANGLAYFIASILGDYIDLGYTHYENTGCLNDFWQDKRGVDVGMRSAFICSKCFAKTDLIDTNIKKIYEDIKSILDLVSSFSRQGKDILEAEAGSMDTKNNKFDVFLCHNSEDKPFVKIISSELKQRSIRTWLDEEQLTPGRPWQMELEQQINNIRSAAVFVGKNGIGPWQKNEIRAFLSEFVNRGCPVIPVILPDTQTIPDLPIFLKQMTWIDLRKDYLKGIERLCRAIK